MRIFSTLIIISFFVTQKSISQNVGIGTTTPQTTLDVKGNFRSGGSNNFITYDSTTGKITWSNSNLFVPTPQYIIKHSASSEGLYSNGTQLEYRNQLGFPSFFTDWANGNGYFAGNVGIGTITPSSKLEITHNGASAYGTALLVNQNVIGNSDGPKIQFNKTMASSKSWTAGILNGVNIPTFGISEDGGTGGFGIPRFTIAQGGNVGIGTSSPNAALGFPPLLGKKITLYPGTTGDVGFAVAGNRLQIYSDNPNADVAVGYDAAGTFNERFAFKPNGALAINGNTGTSGQVLQSNGSGAAAGWVSSTNVVYNNTSEVNGAGPVTVSPSGGVETDLPGMVFTVTVATTAKALLSFNVPIRTNGCFGCGASLIEIYFTDNLSTIPGFHWSIGNTIDFQLNGNDLYTLTPGTHTIKLVAVVSSLGSSASVTFGNTNPGPSVNIVNNMIVQVIPQ